MQKWFLHIKKINFVLSKQAWKTYLSALPAILFQKINVLGSVYEKFDV